MSHGSHGVASLDPDRVRAAHWAGEGVDIATVIEQLHRLHAELTKQDVAVGEHPHPRNAVLNLIVLMEEPHRRASCTKLVETMAASHPMRALLVHRHGGSEHGVLDAEITTEAHQLVHGFPVQREQVLLHVRGQAAEHVSSLVEPLLISDLPTYFWWTGSERLDESALVDAVRVSDVLIVDSHFFRDPVAPLLELAAFVGQPDLRIGLADFRWTRLRPWREAVAQVFGPAERRPFLAGLREVSVDCAGSSLACRVGGAMLAGWLAAALDWGFVHRASSTGALTEANAKAPGGHRVRVALRSATFDGQADGTVVGIRLEGVSEGRSFALTIAREPGAGSYARVHIDAEGSVETVKQRLSLPEPDEPALMMQVVAESRHDPLFRRCLMAAGTLLEALRGATP
jgi:glucose-6-phosphate dehydrogenase assembly protein OpcA